MGKIEFRASGERLQTFRKRKNITAFSEFGDVC